MPDQNRGRGASFWVAIVLAVLLIIVVLQNSQTVTIDLLFFTSIETPLVLALAATGLVGALIGWLVPRVRRHD